MENQQTMELQIVKSNDEHIGGTKAPQSHLGDESVHGSKWQPMVGMEFDNLDGAYHYYQRFAKEEGFCVVKRGCRRDLDGQLKYQTFTCQRARHHKPRGTNILRHRPSGRVGCLARVCVTLLQGLWKVTKVELTHNHSLSPAHLLRQRRVVAPPSERQLQVIDFVSKQPRKNSRAIAARAGGDEELTNLSKYFTNHGGKLTSLQLENGDAESVLSLFQQMQHTSRDFFYAVDVDSEARLRNVFWVDGRSRAAYQEFGDVVLFDTTYLVKKYKVPLASFVGMNHHGQLSLFGCALIGSNDTETYTWLFHTWLKCMLDRSPRLIITDQCNTIAEAVAIMFPDTQHRWCLRHIMSKFTEKMGNHSSCNDLKEVFMSIVHDTLSVPEFEEKWAAMVDSYTLQTNSWILSLYEGRGHWVPVFVKTGFWAGMFAMRRSGNMNSFFDKYVHPQSRLKQFVEQYGKALRVKITEEVEADFASSNTLIPCMTRFYIEKQFQAAYTNRIFSEVQKELIDIMYCEVEIVRQDDEKVDYEVQEWNPVGGGRRCAFKVVYDVNDSSVECNCGLFEFKGLLCRHVFRVLVKRNIVKVPNIYILRHWRKDIVRCHSKIMNGVSGSEDSVQLMRMKELEEVFYSSVDLAVDSLAKSDFLLKSLKDIYVRIENWAPSIVVEDNLSISGLNRPAAVNGDGVGDANNVSIYEDPPNAQPNGKSRKNFVQSRIQSVAVMQSGTRSQIGGANIETSPTSKEYASNNDLMVSFGGEPISVSTEIRRESWLWPEK